MSNKRQLKTSYYFTLIGNYIYRPYLTWNGTMFGDHYCPLNALRGFVSVSWASCFWSESGLVLRPTVSDLTDTT